MTCTICQGNHLSLHSGDDSTAITPRLGQVLKGCIKLCDTREVLAVTMTAYKLLYLRHLLAKS
jgi:hypothetical protein